MTAASYGAGFGRRRDAGGRGGGFTGRSGLPAASHWDVITDATPLVASLIRFSRIGFTVAKNAA
jgi:hypothetical protein